MSGKRRPIDQPSFSSCRLILGVVIGPVFGAVFGQVALADSEEPEVTQAEPISTPEAETPGT